MSEYKMRIFIAGILAVILVSLLGGASYYLLPPEPQPSPTPTATPSPTPTPTPGTMPTPLGPEIRLEVASLEGFSYTEMGNAFVETIPVLHQGTSGNITLTVRSLDEKSIYVSLGLSAAGMSKELEGVNYKFDPSTLELPPKGEANSTLILEADLDAPNGLYLPMLTINLEGFRYATSLDSYLLIFPYTPDYVFYIIARTQETLTPPPPSPTNETHPSPVPTPIPTPPPWWEPEPWEPEIQVERGGETSIMFYIYAEIESPSLTLNLTYQSGALPGGINAKITQNPLKVVQNPSRNRSLLLTLTTDPDTPEGTYRIVAEGSVGEIAFERAFNLTVTGS